MSILTKLHSWLARPTQLVTPPPAEHLVLRFIVERRVPTEAEFLDVVDHFSYAPEFTPLFLAPRIYGSEHGCVRVDRDIFGYEIRICGGPMLDTTPAYYRLTDEQAKRLEHAILGCVPGSAAYAARFVPRSSL